MISGLRFVLDLFIPEAVYAAIPPATKAAIRDRIRQLKSYAVKINEGAGTEEITIRAVWHVCYHDEPGPRPCDPEQDV